MREGEYLVFMDVILVGTEGQAHRVVRLSGSEEKDGGLGPNEMTWYFQEMRSNKRVTGGTRSGVAEVNFVQKYLFQDEKHGGGGGGGC